jgi:ABC-2 type transport system permease protein
MQKEANLLQTDFAFIGESGKQTDDNGQSRIIWGLWALFAVLSSLLLSDWIIREKHMSAAVRFLFLKFSLQKYLVCHAVLYTGLFFLFDLFAAGLFYFYFPEAVNLSFVLALLSFRVMVSTGAFLLALCFRKTFLYDCTAFILTLLLAITAGLINADAGQIIAFHPLKPFLSGEMTVFWPGVFILLIIIWYFRKERSDA